MLKMTSSSDFSGITMMSYLADPADPGSKPRVVAQVEEHEITDLGSNPGALCPSFLRFYFD